MSLSTIFSSVTSLIIFALFTIVYAKKLGFTAELIHRDSVNSPLYKSFETPSQRIANAFRRSINRANFFYPTASFSSKAPATNITPSGGAYLMNITIGTPPVDIVAIADTGSDLTWTQCQPCPHCYKQVAPMFNPKESTTYKNIPCESMICRRMDSKSCRRTKCIYVVEYGDQSYSEGNLAMDSVGVPSTSGELVIFPKIVLGCGHRNKGTFSETTSGIIGLGGGNLSLIHQLGPVGRGIFSYCLTPLLSNITSKIHFGASAVVDGEGALSIPITKKYPSTFYYLTLKGMSVGDERFAFYSNESSAYKGNVIIDSGTTLTMLPSGLYDKVKSAVKNQIKHEIIKDPTGQLSLCYKAEGDKFEAPTITAHFDGADIKLNTENTFVEMSEGIACFAMIPMQSLGAVGGIIGNIAQANFLVGYDLKKNTLTFKPTNCAEKA